MCAEFVLVQYNKCTLILICLFTREAKDKPNPTASCHTDPDNIGGSISDALSPEILRLHVIIRRFVIIAAQYDKCTLIVICLLIRKATDKPNPAASCHTETMSLIRLLI